MGNRGEPGMVENGGGTVGNRDSRESLRVVGSRGESRGIVGIRGNGEELGNHGELWESMEWSSVSKTADEIIKPEV